MREALRKLDPRRWSVAVRAVAMCFVASLVALPRLVDRVERALCDGRSSRAYRALNLPRVEAALSPLRAAVRVRVSPDVVDLDMRALSDALPTALRRRVWDATDPLWREALLVESPAMLRLTRGRLRDDGQLRGRLRSLRERVDLVRDAVRDVPVDDLPFEAHTSPLFFVDGSVPIATLAALIRVTALGGYALAVRGPRGLSELTYRSTTCGPAPSVRLVVSASRFVLSSTSDRGACERVDSSTHACVVTLDRTTEDRGFGALRSALLATPWTISALLARERTPAGAPRTDAAERVVRSLLEAQGPWGAISVEADGELPYADVVAVLVAARERSPDRCRSQRSERDEEGCLFPYFELGVARRR